MTSVTNVNNYSANRAQVTKLPQPDKRIEHRDYVEYVYRTDASTGKKVGVGIASFALPGLGQCINGQWGKGIGMGFGFLLLQLLPFISATSIRGNHGGVGKLAVSSIISLVGTLGLGITSIIDAVKNAKSETVRIVSKEEDETMMNKYDDDEYDEYDDEYDEKDVNNKSTVKK